MSARPEIAEPVYMLDGDVALPSRHAVGPWDPGIQHGAGPAALVARAAERPPAAAPMRVARRRSTSCARPR